MNLIWEEFLNILKQEVGSHVMETWFKAVAFEQWDPQTQTVCLVMPNVFVSNWIQEHYTALIKTHLSRLLHKENIKIFFLCKNATDTYKHPITPALRTTPATILEPENDKKNLDTFFAPRFSNPYKKEDDGLEKKHERKLSVPVLHQTKRPQRIESVKLNDQYTFNTFVVGPTNELAHAAAVAVSQNIGKVYNPLFIYGGTGLGKTHLLHAIANELKVKNPAATICYETSDTFINEFVNAIKLDKTRHFREKYQKVDLLLLDDIQFFSHKEQTQETFFHIFDALYGRQRQVVFSSDTLPQHILGLQGRLKSRLQCGLVADVQMPTPEMKMAILKKKALFHAIQLHDDVARFIAERPSSSIRELEGYLIRLSAFASISSEPITVEIAKRVLQSSQMPKEPPVSLEAVLKAIVRHYNISISDLKSKKRNKQVVFSRQIAFYMMKKHTPHSLQIIGEYMGGKDHTTVLHAINKIEALLKNDQELGQKLNLIQKIFVP